MTVVQKACSQSQVGKMQRLKEDKVHYIEYSTSFNVNDHMFLRIFAAS